MLEGADEDAFWRGVREATPQFLRDHENGAVVRTSCRLSDVGPVLNTVPDRAIARAGSGVCYGYYENAADVRFPSVGISAVEFAPQQYRESNELWPRPGNDFEMMKKIKAMFDPQGILNRGRLYGRI